ncbi:MAG: hypothetical protein K2F81_05530 [Ruminococcus sp.]|nr:hypothetical protein [Ruminococcus sp.]
MILVKFSETLDDVNDSQFIKARVRCFSDGLTSHDYYFELDNVKNASETLLGKPILWAYDFWVDDCKGHEKHEIPCGFIPNNIDDANIEYVYVEKYKKTFVEVNCYIWRVYAEKLEEILKRTDGIKDVSVELWLIKQKENSVKRRTDVLEYCYTGVTILGEDINPAVKGAKIEVVKFSENDYEKAKEDFIKNTLYNSEKVDENMDEIKQDNNSEVQELDNAKVYDTVRVSVSKDTDVYDDNGNYIGNTYENHSKSKTTITEVDDETLNNAEEDNDSKEECSEETSKIEKNCFENQEYKLKFEELSTKYTILQNSYNELKENCDILTAKCSELSEYKTNKENTEMKLAIECALSDVSDILSASEIAEWREKSIKCENIDAFKNELKAFAFDKGLNCSSTKSTIRKPIPVNVVTDSANVWNRLKNEF